MQVVDAAGKPLLDSLGTLLIKESGAIYNPATNIAALGPGGNPLAASMSANLGSANIASAANVKDGQIMAGTTNSQAIAQGLQGLIQQGQGAAIIKLDETGKPIGKGIGGASLTETISGQTGKKGSSLGEGATGTINIGMIGMPLVTGTKGSGTIDGGADVKLPVSGSNPTNANIIITAAAGGTTSGQPGTTIPGQTGSTVPGQTTTTGATAGTGTNTPGQNTPAGSTPTHTPGAHDPNATDIRSLMTTFSTVHIVEGKKGDSDNDAPDRPEIDYDSVDSNDFDDDDEYVDTPAVEIRRSGAGGAASDSGKKPANIGLSIIENIMVMINDIKNRKVDDLTAKRCGVIFSLICLASKKDSR